MFILRLFRFSMLSVVFFISACAATSDDQIESTNAINNDQTVDNGQSSTPDQGNALPEEPVDTQSPDAPANLRLSAPAQPSAVYLAWDVSTDNVGVVGYRIYRNGNLFNSTTSNTLVDVTVNQNTVYQYFVEAYDAANNTARSGVLSILTPIEPDVTEPTAPSNLISTQLTSTQVSISWNASADNVGVAGYRIFRNGSLLTTISATFYNDLAVNGNTSYQYQVEAFDAANNTARSNLLNVTTPAEADVVAPTVPSNLVANQVTSDQVSLGWNASTDNVGVVGYRVFRNGGLLTITTANSYNDLTVNDDTTYQYQIEVYDAENNTARSNLLSVTTLVAPDVTAPAAPSNLNADTVTSDEVSLSWNASTDNIAVAGYRVFRNGSLLTTTTTTSYADLTVNDDTTYQYQIEAYDAANNTARSNLLSVTTLVAPDVTAPSIPGGLTVTEVTTDLVSFSWTASTDNIAVTAYRIYKNNSSVPYATTASSSFTDSNLAASQAYTYSVAAVDAAGNESQLSADLNVTTLAEVAAQNVDLRWIAPTQNTDDSCVGSIQGYQLHYGVESENYTTTLSVDMNSGDIVCEQTGFDNVCNVAVMTCTYTVQSLDPGTWYFAMQTIDASGVESDNSNEISKLVN